MNLHDTDPQPKTLAEAIDAYFGTSHPYDLTNVSTGELVSELSKRTGVQRLDADKAIKFTAKLSEGSTVLII